METHDKTAVELLQELIAIYTTRKEAVERLSAVATGKTNNIPAAAIKEQSDQFLRTLLDELSAFGDGIPADTDRSNEYFKIWTNSLKRIESVTATEGVTIFNALEDSLRTTYLRLLETSNDLPESFRRILVAQQEQLQEKQ